MIMMIKHGATNYCKFLYKFEYTIFEGYFEKIYYFQFALVFTLQIKIFISLVIKYMFKLF